MTTAKLQHTGFLQNINRGIKKRAHVVLNVFKLLKTELKCDAFISTHFFFFFFYASHVCQ